MPFGANHKHIFPDMLGVNTEAPLFPGKNFYGGAKCVNLIIPLIDFRLML